MYIYILIYIHEYCFHVSSPLCISLIYVCVCVHIYNYQNIIYIYNHIHMGVSHLWGYPQSSISNDGIFHEINHVHLGSPILGNLHIHHQIRRKPGR